MSKFTYEGGGFNQRLRSNKTIRDLVKETSSVTIDELICPLFIRHGDESYPIKSMPGQTQWCLRDLQQQIHELKQLSIKAVMLFGIPKTKDNHGCDNTSDHGIIPTAIRLIKDTYPELFVISDMCLCDYSSHGHCFVLTKDQKIDKQQTLAYLSKASVVHAQAGSDMIAPSGNVDHMVKAIRHALDETSYTDVPILSYSAKYCTALYGPFREACDSAPQYFDRSSYQVDKRNIKEGLKEALCDISEGADMVMVKPASYYLDVLHYLSQNLIVPIAAYQVSGEYSMIKIAAEAGIFDKKKIVTESLQCIKRAGANTIITYFAKDYAQWICN
jgi:porphobilinogen synthase